MQLEPVEKERLKKRRTGILQPVDNLSISAQRVRVNKIAKQEHQLFEEQSKILYHLDDHPTLHSLTYELPNQTWVINYDSKNKTKEQHYSEKIVNTLDQEYISREAYRALAAISFDLPREYTIAATRNQINEIMKVAVPIRVLDINSLYPTEIDNIDENIEVHINDLQIINNVTESIGKCGYRSIIDILLYLIPVWMAENILTNQDSTIHIRISGDGRNVGRKVKHVMITFAILNNNINIYLPDNHYTLALYPGTENYTTLKISLAPLCQDLTELKMNGIKDTFGKHWNVELYFSSDWKFLAISLGFNAANSNFFCPWCSCSRKDLGNKEKQWIINKNMEQIVAKPDTYSGHTKLPLFSMIPITHWVVDELHILLRIYDRLWGLALQECKRNGNFNDSMRTDICNEMHVIGVKFHFWQDSESKSWNYTALMGEDKLLVLEKFNLAIMLPNIRARQVRNLWSGFYQLYKNIKDPATDPEIFADAVKTWFGQFLKPSDSQNRGLYRPADVTPYMHVLVFHVPEFMHIHQRFGLRAFSCSGVEKKNHKQVCYFFSKTMKDGGKTQMRYSAILEILFCENRSLYFQKHKTNITRSQPRRLHYKANPEE